jgi:superfamily II DNA or RNA helicase
MVQVTTRLAYTLWVSGRLQRVTLTPMLGKEGPVLSEGDVKKMRHTLHPLDKVIVNDMCAAAVFGQVSDAELARLLPLLAQRHTVVDGQRLKISENTLVPRVRVEGEDTLVALVLTLQDPVSGRMYLLDEGRLLASAQAYFMVEGKVFNVSSPAPWDLQKWAKPTGIELRRDRFTATERDHWVRELLKVGVPEEDLGALVVRRGPPETFVATVVMQASEGMQPRAGVRLEVLYGAHGYVLDGSMSGSGAYAEVSSLGDGGTLLERDVMAENVAKEELYSRGFKYDKASGMFVVEGDMALRLLDTQAKVLPSQWSVLRQGARPVFHKDLALHAKVGLLEDRGLLDVEMRVSAVGEDAGTVQALLEMKDLLLWLQSGERYLKLEDGSFVEPSAVFRQSLMLVRDLGVEGNRALVSPLCVGVLRAIGARAQLEVVDEATKAWLEELSQDHGPKECEVPAGLNAVLRDYQKRGLDWLMMLHRHRLTGILADDMGLGKTMQTLAMLLSVKALQGPKPSLVVAPTSVIGVWRDEMTRFAPGMRVALWYGARDERQTLQLQEYDVVVTSYGILRRDVEVLSQHDFRYVILDEAQSAKNAVSQNAKAIRQLKSERRLALTGTPIENHLDELWAVFDFLAPGFLGSIRQFRQKYGRPVGRGEQDALDVLRTRIQPLVLRRLKGEVAKELPPKIETVVRCDMGMHQRALYDHIAGELRESVQQKIAEVGIDRAHLDILAALTRLRQICCDPALLPEPPSGVKHPPSAKLALFEELMREALASDRKVVVFSQFVEMQKRLIQVVKHLGVKPLWLHGGTTNRDEVVASFQKEDGPPVIVVSLRAGGTGLTLTRADTVIHYDPWWNPAVERQATDRAHRLGQRNTVNVYKLVCSTTIEERVLDLAKNKEVLAEELLGSVGGAQSKRITTHEVLSLLSQ